MSPEVRRPLNQVHFKNFYHDFLNQPVKQLVRHYYTRLQSCQGNVNFRNLLLANQKLQAAVMRASLQKHRQILTLPALFSIWHSMRNYRLWCLDVQMLCNVSQLTEDFYFFVVVVQESKQLTLACSIKFKLTQSLHKEHPYFQYIYDQMFQTPQLENVK